MMGPWEEVVAFQIQGIQWVYILCENGQTGRERESGYLTRVQGAKIQDRKEARLEAL